MTIAAAAAVVLATAGVANRFGWERPSSEAPVGVARVEGSAAPSARANAAGASEPLSGRTAAARVEPVSGGPVQPRTAPVVNNAAPHNAAPPPPRVKELQSDSWQVQHLHRLGSCAGRLGVSTKGLMFTPDDRSSKDAFILPHDEFLPSSTDRTLTIKSNTKTYRFRVADAKTSEVGAALARFR